eukprot:CAMPEP_0114316374 /NCGR_PEP_ID=MMETSP0059-20121206/23166_1 /TAXON_ID=36894 /ORGANISM="Pyramimonas parkeae, Strain CCMP726" /LENGTH=97 /DNA_ID=CAMNT_0001442295 /DNA_START=236 /DNA_END=527 /DNA_ORIENTATION=-
MLMRANSEIPIQHLQRQPSSYFSQKMYVLPTTTSMDGARQKHLGGKVASNELSLETASLAANTAARSSPRPSRDVDVQPEASATTPPGQCAGKDGAS